MAGAEFAMLNTLVVTGKCTCSAKRARAASGRGKSPGKALVWGSFRSGGGQRQDAGSWASLLRGGRPDGCTRRDRRSQAGPEIEGTREQKDGR